MEPRFYVIHWLQQIRCKFFDDLAHRHPVRINPSRHDAGQTPGWIMGSRKEQTEDGSGNVQSITVIVKPRVPNYLHN